jgi:hypothetical protein
MVRINMNNDEDIDLNPEEVFNLIFGGRWLKELISNSDLEMEDKITANDIVNEFLRFIKNRVEGILSHPSNEDRYSYEIVKSMFDSGTNPLADTQEELNAQIIDMFNR